MRDVSICSPAAALWPPKRFISGAHDSRHAEHVESGDAAARSVRDVAVDREHDRRPVERIDQLRGDDADDAAVPALTRHDQDAAGADSGSVSTIFFALARMS